MTVPSPRPSANGQVTIHLSEPADPGDPQAVRARPAQVYRERTLQSLRRARAWLSVMAVLAGAGTGAAVAAVLGGSPWQVLAVVVWAVVFGLVIGLLLGLRWVERTTRLLWAVVEHQDLPPPPPPA